MSTPLVGEPPGRHTRSSTARWSPSTGFTIRSQYCSGNTARHGVNLQVLADPAGRLASASPTLPGSRTTRPRPPPTTLIDVLTSNNVATLVDKAHQGEGGTVRTPFKRHRQRPRQSDGQKAVNRAYAPPPGPR